MKGAVCCGLWLVLSAVSVRAGARTCVGPHSPLRNGTRLPCGPGNELCPRNCSRVDGCDGFAQLAPWGTPVGYHIRDLTCGLNDPNGPVYDPNNGMYHLFYQDHLGVNGGTVWGHVASRNMKKWAHLPVALWNDREYDSSAIFSGSATVVNGEIILIYPGLCNSMAACKDEGGGWSPPGKCNITTQCVSGRNLALAKPADTGDPFLRNWTKLGVIINSSNACGGHCNGSAPGDRGKDPSAAWQTPSGEWRFVTGDTPIVYGSMDFEEWYYIGLGFTNGGKTPQGNGGDCPSFFPLPAITPGAGPPPNVSRGTTPYI